VLQQSQHRILPHSGWSHWSASARVSRETRTNPARLPDRGVSSRAAQADGRGKPWFRPAPTYTVSSGIGLGGGTTCTIPMQGRHVGDRMVGPLIKSSTLVRAATTSGLPDGHVTHSAIPTSGREAHIGEAGPRTVCRQSSCFTQASSRAVHQRVRRPFSRPPPLLPLPPPPPRRSSRRSSRRSCGFGRLKMGCSMYSALLCARSSFNSLSRRAC